MARVNRVTVKLDPLAAISGGNSIAEVNLEGADVLLETNAAGEANWSALAAAAGAAIASSLGILSPSASVASGVPVTLSNSTVTIADAAGHANTFGLGSVGIGDSSAPSYLVAAGPGPCDKDNQDPAANMAATPGTRQTATGTPRKN
jgi:hypothetical protein